MATLESAGEAVSRIAYLSSHVVVSAQPSLAGPSEFSPSFKKLAASKTAGVTSPQPSIEVVRQNEDPLLSLLPHIQAGKSVSATIPSSVLLSSVPLLYRLAQHPVVLHVSLSAEGPADYSDITSVRQCGFTFLHSDSLHEAQDLALTAHALARQSGKGVVHFFDSAKLVNEQAVFAAPPEFVQEILDLDSPAGRLGTTQQVDQSVYADEGTEPSLVDAPRVPLATSPLSLDKLQSAAPRPSSARDASSSSGSPRRQSDSEEPSVASSATSVMSAPVARSLSSQDILDLARKIWARIFEATGRRYDVFDYTGPADAASALLVFGADAADFARVIGEASPADIYKKAGLISIRLYRPWFASALSDVIPRSVKRVAVLEQRRRKTTKWGPVFLDSLASMSGRTGSADGIKVVAYQLGQIETATIRQGLNGIFSNLLNETPIQNLEVGGSSSGSLVRKQTLEQPPVEDAYNKVLAQVFGDRLFVANKQKSASLSTTTAALPESGLGALLARQEARTRFIKRVSEAAKTNDFTTSAPLKWLAQWAMAADDVKRCSGAAQAAISRLSTDGSPVANELLRSKAFFNVESQWLIGSDSWAYDLGNSGVHHLLASGRNANMLIIDSTPYSEQAAKDANRRKKDIGLYAMNFGNAYVASTAVYSSYTQVLQALIEADQFNGPSIVLAYLPYNTENDSPITVLQETKKAVDLGYWPLYRWHPATETQAEPRFDLDSERIKQELKAFLDRENQLTQLAKREPQLASNLAGNYGKDVRELQKRKAKDAYANLLDGLAGAPVTVLYASDNGNAEKLAKRLANRSKLRGLKSSVFEMDEYPLDDLSGEENVVMITATAGQGEFPQNGRQFWEGIKGATDLDLSTVHFTVFALGDSHYWPRKEDKIYYNKPGKDLFSKVAALGGQVLTEIGLGDDQDADTYNTGYNEWEPKLWQSLGVAHVEGLPEEPPPMTNEDIKIQSNFLRGTIAEGLEDPSTGAIAAADQQLTKFHGTYMQDDRDLRDERKAQGLEPAYSFMIRCRLPGGVATPSQWMQMDDISTNLGNETMKLTTRQTFQFHGVVKGKLRPAMQAINKALMTTLAACGDVNRNVMLSTIPTQSEYHAQVYEVAKKISDHLLPATSAYHEIWLKDADDKKTQVAGNAVVDDEPLYGATYLPRKFKITIAVPPHNDTDVYAHDVGLIAIKGADGNLEGFNVLAGGGMGVTHNMKKTYPRTGSMLGFATPEKVHLVCEKIMLVQKEHGDRKNRKHARLKYTMDDMGVDVFKGKVEELFGAKLGEPKPFHFDSNIDTFGWQRDERGMHHFTMFIENGRIEDTSDFPMKTGLREIAKVHQGEFRLTGNQHLVLSNVSDAELPRIKEMLAKYKLDNTNFSGLRLSSSACVAFPTCGLAMAESERYLPSLVTKLESTLEESGLRQDSIVLRVTGCPNGCARPWLAEIALVGKSYGTYNLMLGGGYHGQRLNKLYRASIAEEEILGILRPLIKEYAIERKEGERFGDFVIRKGVIKPTLEGKFFHDDTPEDEEDEA